MTRTAQSGLQPSTIVTQIEHQCSTQKYIILICYTQKYTFLICHTAWHFHTQPKEKPNLNHLQLKQSLIWAARFLFLPKRPFRRVMYRMGYIHL